MRFLAMGVGQNKTTVKPQSGPPEPQKLYPGNATPFVLLNVLSTHSTQRNADGLPYSVT